MLQTPDAPRERLLDPVSRISEILFGLIMALTFTGTLDVASAGNEDVRLLLVGTIGCNIAWGLVDAVMFLIAALTERGRNLVTVRRVRAATSAPYAHGIIAGALPPVVASLMTPDDMERLRQGLVALPDIPARPSLNKEDGLRAVAVFLLVFLSTFPVVVPFMVIDEVQTALRTSNLVAIVMMFAAGYFLARHGGYRPMLTGASMVLLGVTLVAIAISLGG
jgi:VIT1/CCC1 family predicted Fe2+/Mn2+ transporter